MNNYKDLREEFEFLINQIKFHNKKYYLENSQEISDSEFDLLNKRLYEILEIDQSLKNEFKEIDLLGAPSNFPDEKKKSHLKQMSSLQNLFNFDDLVNFDKRVYKFLGTKYKESLKSQFEYCLEQKFDGLSFSALYIDGKFVLGLTRGDGFIGEDITQNLACLSNWPKNFSNDINFKIPKKIEIRGEVFMPIKKFEELNLEFERNNEKKFVNPRNAASGSLRVLDESEVKKRGLEYFAYSIGYIDEDYENSPKTQNELIAFLKMLGFKTSSFIKTTNDLNEIHAIYLDVLNFRNSLEYEIDGIVVKLNRLDFQEKIGHSGKYPRFAAAFKFPSNEGFTRLLDVNFSIGRTGAFTPVASLEPLRIGGALISYASLHNFDEIDRLDLMINDIVLLKRSGDVIPQIVSVLKEKRLCEGELGRKKIIKPKLCPSCFEELINIDDEVALRCENFVCKAKMIEYIKYFCSRDVLNVIGLGDKQINYFFSMGFIKNPYDIFFLEEKFGNEIKKLPNWGEKSSSNLFLNIEKARNISFEKFIYSLGIRFVGQSNSKLIAKFFIKTSSFLDFVKMFANYQSNQMKINQIFNAIEDVDGIGEKVIKSLIFFLRNLELRELILNLAQILKIDDYNDEMNLNQKNIQANQFFGKNIVFTGSLKSMSRGIAKEIISKKFGGNVQSTLTKTTNFLILGEDAGSKLQKAFEIPGIKILKEEDFLSLIN